MIVKLLKSKIHDCFITDHNVNYEGSILINKTLMEAAGFLPNEKVHVLSVTDRKSTRLNSVTPISRMPSSA